jgi:hypothetical protein
MARFRLLVRQSPAIVIATLALVFSLGGGAGYAASSAHRSVRATFHKLTLKNGWKPVTANGIGAPSYAISGGVVYLTGGMDQPSGSARTFAVLPVAARPKHTLWIGVFSEATTSAFLEVLPSGAMLIGGDDRQSFASLAGVAFPVGS